MDVRGRQVLVTGGSRGIGRGVAAALVERGARVTIVARSPEAAAKEIGASAIAADLASPEGIAALAGRLQGLDVLVNNAGLDAVGPYAEMSAELSSQLWHLNVLAPAELTRALLPDLIARRAGRVVFVSSLSSEVALAGLAAYSATKAAVSQLAEGLREELRGTGVGITLVELGAVRTELYGMVREHAPTARAFDRVHRTGALRELELGEVTGAIVQAIEHDRGTVVLPRRGRLQWAMARLPQRINRLLQLGNDRRY